MLYVATITEYSKFKAIRYQAIRSHLDLEGRQVVGVGESDFCHASSIQVRDICSFKGHPSSIST